MHHIIRVSTIFNKSLVFSTITKRGSDEKRSISVGGNKLHHTTAYHTFEKREASCQK
jgi:hypothetical protein